MTQTAPAPGTMTTVLPEAVRRRRLPRNPIGKGTGNSAQAVGSRTRSYRMMNVIVTIVLSIGGILMIAPLLWTFSTSLKTREAVFALPPQWIPDPVQWENYVRVWTAGPLASGIMNSVIVSVSVTVSVR